MKKIFTIALCILLGVIGTILLYNHNKSNRETVSRIGVKDPNCNGEKNESYSIGFGIEHEYTGTIIEGKNVKAILSCDHDQITISGSVSQKILAKDIRLYDEEVVSESERTMIGDYGDFTELADLSRGAEIAVDFGNDYNFDGYNDLATLASSGSGYSTILVFLYNPKSNTFEFSRDISSKINIYPNKDEKILEQRFGSMNDGYSLNLFKWTENDKLYKYRMVDCLSNREFNPNDDIISSYQLQIFEYNEAGVVVSSSTKLIKARTEAEQDVACIDPKTEDYYR